MTESSEYQNPVSAENPFVQVLEHIKQRGLERLRKNGTDLQTVGAFAAILDVLKLHPKGIDPALFPTVKKYLESGWKEAPMTIARDYHLPRLDLRGLPLVFVDATNQHITLSLSPRRQKNGQPGEFVCMDDPTIGTGLKPDGSPNKVSRILLDTGNEEQPGNMYETPKPYQTSKTHSITPILKQRVVDAFQALLDYEKAIPAQDRGHFTSRGNQLQFLKQWQNRDGSNIDLATEETTNIHNFLEKVSRGEIIRKNSS